MILLLGGSHIAEAGMRDALNFLRRDDYASALPHLNEAAIEGRTSAQVLLAQLYLEGKFGKPEPKKAAGWFKKAALANPRNGSFVAIAQTDLANLYWDGVGVKMSKKKAIELYQKAARNGNGRSQSVIAGFYYHGNGVKKDIVQSLKWTLLSAANRNPKSKAALNVLAKIVTPEQIAQARAEAKKLFPNKTLPEIPNK